MVKAAPYFAVPTAHVRKRQAVGNQFLYTQRHGSRSCWWKAQHFSRKPFGIQRFRVAPRILLDRDLMPGELWSRTTHHPEIHRWERVVNSLRVTEDRYALVEEEGKMHRVNWKLYCQRVETELQAAKDHVPQYKVLMKAAPVAWKKLEIDASVIRGLSLREALAQCKLSNRKGHQVLYRALEMASQGAEGKGLDKDKLRITKITVRPGPTDKQIDIRSKGYYSWKTKKASNVAVVVAEDPEMVLPDRTAIPYASMMSLRGAGLRSEPTVLDVPAITADGI